tara:strand:- start:3128 stop:4051 length:924 start_codon:yes stop_codon:yes gene_type:complete
MAQDDGIPTTNVDSTLSAAQLAEISNIFEAHHTEFFINQHSNRILKRVSATIFVALGIVGAFLTWAGYENYQNMTTELEASVASEVSSQVSAYINASADGIRDQVREMVDSDASQIATREIDKALTRQVRPEINRFIQEFEDEIATISSLRLEQVTDRFVRIFPILNDLQELNATNSEDIKSRFLNLEDGSLKNELEIESQKSTLTSTLSKIENIGMEFRVMEENMSIYRQQLQDAQGSIGRLGDEVAKLQDVRESTEQICTLFTILPTKNIVDALGYPIPENDDGEYLYRLNSAVSAVKIACDPMP